MAIGETHKLRYRAWLGLVALRRCLVSVRTSRERRRRDRERLGKLRSASGLLLDVGSSSLHLPGWLSLDIEPDEHGIRMDATKPWPFGDGSARAIRSEHMIEHLGYEEGLAFLREAHRVLEPGGVIRVCTPDLEGISRAYLERDPRVLEAHRRHKYVAPTWAHLVNNYARSWGHRFLYDFDALRQMLGESGFDQVERVRFGESRYGVLAGTDSHDMGELELLVVCVDAVKPRA